MPLRIAAAVPTSLVTWPMTLVGASIAVDLRVFDVTGQER